MAQTNGISIDTFMRADQETRDRIIFELLSRIESNQCGQILLCSERFKALESDRIKNKISSAAGGVLGGIAAVVGKWIIFK